MSIFAIRIFKMKNIDAHRVDFISDVDQHRITNICKRLKNSVTTTDIINWLFNFKSTEIHKALTVLEHTEYITESEIIDIYETGLSAILSQKPSVKVIIHPVSDYGKSGTLMSYYLKKTPSYSKNKDRITFFSHYDNFKYKLKGNNSSKIIIFIDDFSGSGKQFNNYYKTFVKPQIQSATGIESLFFLTLFYQPKAKSTIQSANPEINIVGNVKYPIFLTNRSVFGSRDSMLPIRNFCYFYGEHLFSVYDKKRKMNIEYPLGFDNSQALIIFAYNPPNNTLPIIWSSKNWKPLYPRIPEYKIFEAKKIRKELAHQIGQLRDSDISSFFYSGKKDLGWKSISFITKTDFITYSIMSLLKQRRTIPVICQILGITEKDYADFISAKPDLFDGLQELTDYGAELYIDVKKQLRLVKKDIRKDDIDVGIRQVKYLPKNFKGES